MVGRGVLYSFDVDGRLPFQDPAPPHLVQLHAKEGSGTATAQSETDAATDIPPGMAAFADFGHKNAGLSSPPPPPSAPGDAGHAAPGR